MEKITPRILYCDPHCVVVNKIAGEAVESAGKGMTDLPRLLAEELASPSSMDRQGSAQPHWPPPAEDALALPTAAHRLDVPVSGCAVFARTKGALANLNEAFAKNAVERIYWAIVEVPESNKAVQWLENTSSQNAELVHWVEFSPRINKSIAHNEPGPRRKKAILRCRQIGRGRDYLFLAVELVTGRHHQIRVQLQKMGLHIKGDLKYGSRRSEKSGGIRLHARSLVFPNPADSSQPINVQAAPPMKDNLWLAFEEAATSAASGA